MKVGILTFHASFNYGSMLQAWALQQVVKSLGNEVTIVNYRSAIQKRLYAHPFRIKSFRDVLSFGFRTLKYGFSYWSKGSRWKLFNSFLRQQLNIGKECGTEEELRETYKDLDVLICGSDQIWNPVCLDFSPIYFGNFHSKNKVKIAYAPSLGQHPETLEITVFKRNLMDFNAISVREKRGVDFFKNNRLFDDIEIVCDPTMLLTSKDYETLIEDRPLIEEPYLYYYAPSHHPSHLAIAKEEAQRLGLKLVCDTGYMSAKSNEHDIIYIKTAGPKEFLNLIKFSNYVSASSYHAIVFAILFHKKFTAINGDKDSRKMNLMSELGIEGRNASLSNKDIHPDYKNIDWDIVEKRLDDYRNRSISFLKKAFCYAQ